MLAGNGGQISSLDHPLFKNVRAGAVNRDCRARIQEGITIGKPRALWLFYPC
jgi:hypothetical protein